jgi:hypothetical protein
VQKIIDNSKYLLQIRINRYYRYMLKVIFLPFLASVLLLLLIPFVSYSPGFALVKTCYVTKIGPNAPEQVTFPPGCQAAGAEGITYPPNLGAENPAHPGYFQLPHPNSPSGSYRSYSCPGQSWGAKDLVGVIYTVAERWKQKYPEGYITVGDLNATGHKSHNVGRAVDLDGLTKPGEYVGDYTKGAYNREATIELGKMFVDTNLTKAIWYNDQAVNAAVLAYSRETGKSAGMNMKPIPGHDNHFHVDVKLNPDLPFWEPNC